MTWTQRLGVDRLAVDEVKLYEKEDVLRVFRVGDHSVEKITIDYEIDEVVITYEAFNDVKHYKYYRGFRFEALRREKKCEN
jgi:hypothetical protein